METWDTINQGHIDSETLVNFAENRSALGSSKILEINNHLKSCHDCSEELKLAENTFKAVPIEPVSIFEKIREFFFTPNWAIKPVAGMIIILMLIVPMMTFLPFLADQGDNMQICSIKPGVRDVGVENNIILNRDKRIVKIEFTLPIIEEAKNTYDFELFDPDRRKLLTRHNNPAQSPFAFVIPTVYLQNGKYTLWVVEFENGKELDRHELIFNISFAD